MMRKSHKLFSAKLTENDDGSLTQDEREEGRKMQIEKLREQVDKLVDKFPDAEITWLQSSFTNDGYGFTRITAVVKY